MKLFLQQMNTGNNKNKSNRQDTCCVHILLITTLIYVLNVRFKSFKHFDMITQKRCDIIDLRQASD